MKTRWRITGTFTTTSPLHIGSGTQFDHSRLKDDNGSPCDIQAVVKDYRESEKARPCIPGSALKGVLRAWAKEMLSDAEPAKLNRIFGDQEIEKVAVEAGWAEFNTAFVVEPSSEQLALFETNVPYWRAQSLTGILSHVSIDRFTGAAAHNKLFYEEFVPEGITFQVEIDATRLDEDDVALLLAILEFGSNHATHPYQFGANGADCWGRMKWKLDEVTQFDRGMNKKNSGSVGFESCTKTVALAPVQVSPQPPPHLSASLMLAMRGPFLVNDASRTKHDGMTDDEKKDHTNFTPLRRANGSVWLPASSFRGALRERAAFLLHSINPQATLDNGPIERIFGKTSQSARLVIEEFAELKRCGTRRQDFVAIDRFNGGAAEGAKFDATYADEPQFRTKLTLRLAGLKPHDVALLRVALHDVCQGRVPLGWGASKGYGEASGTLSQGNHPVVPQDWNAPQSLFAGELEDEVVRWLETQLSPLIGPITTSVVHEPAGQTKIAVSTIYEGTLTVTEKPKKKGEWIYTLYFINNKGKAGHITVTNPDTVADDLRDKPSTSVPVDFEDENGKRVRIRPHGQDWATATQDSGATTAAAQDDNTSFANPYYFLRMQNREAFSGDLLDKKPVGHEQYVPGLYSGRIHIKLTTKTRLLICDDESVEEDAHGHKTYALRTDAEGKPLLASSSVRGMLRSAYEAITNSRFGVFPGNKPSKDTPASKQGRRLALRLPANRGLNTVPVRIVADPTSLSGLAAEILPGTSGINSDGTPSGPTFAAWCGFYGGWTPTGLATLGHRDEVWAYLTPWHYHRQLTGRSIDFDFWNVEELAPGPSKPTTIPTRMRVAFGHATPDTWGPANWHRGCLCITQRNMNGKHDERFFFAATSPFRTELSSSHLQQWQQLIENYQEEHLRELANGAVRPPVLQSPSVYSRHISIAPPATSSSERTLAAGDLCYAEVEPNGSLWSIRALYPVIISRKLYEKSPLECLPAKLRPAASLDELSPADRVFGWVNQDETLAQGEAYAAYRSSLRIGSVKCLTGKEEAIDDTPRTLAILAQPKPQQGRFYLGDKVGKAQTGNRSKEQAGYTRENRVRGPKVYPHHGQGIKDANAFTNSPSNQNRTIKGCVKPDTEFECDLSFTNLTPLELGALLWLLSLGEDHYLRLGLGKPLGFGSVRVEVMPDRTVIADGAKWIEAIPHCADPASTDTALIMEQFEATINSVSPGLLPSFKRAASGFGELSIHYPRCQNQNAGSGEHFQWFVANEKNDSPQSLPDLDADHVSLRS